MSKEQIQDAKKHAHGFDDLPQMMTIDQLAEFANMSRTGVAEYIRNGRIRAFNICRGGRPKYRVMRDDIVAWLTGSPVDPIRPEDK